MHQIYLIVYPQTASKGIMNENGDALAPEL